MVLRNRGPPRREALLPLRSSGSGGQHGPTSGAGPNLRSRADAASVPRSCMTVVLRGVRSSPHVVVPRRLAKVLALAPSQLRLRPRLRNWAPDHAPATVTARPRSCVAVGWLSDFFCRSVSIQSPRSSWASAVRGPPPPTVVPRRRNPPCAILRGSGPLGRKFFFHPRFFCSGKIPRPRSCVVAVLSGFQPPFAPSLVPIPHSPADCAAREQQTATNVSIALQHLWTGSNKKIHHCQFSVRVAAKHTITRVSATKSAIRSF